MKNSKKLRVADLPPARVAVFDLLETNPHCLRSLIIGMSRKDDEDEKLAELTSGVGLLAAGRMGSDLVAANLVRVFGFTAGWISLASGLRTQRVLAAIHLEREHQQELLAAGKLSYSCACPRVEVTRKLRVLVEEVGEVAQAVDWVEQLNMAGHRQHLIDELVQVVAVCVAWLEAIEIQKQEAK